MQLDPPSPFVFSVFPGGFTLLPSSSSTTGWSRVGHSNELNGSLSIDSKPDGAGAGVWWSVWIESFFFHTSCYGLDVQERGSWGDDLGGWLFLLKQISKGGGESLF